MNRAPYMQNDKKKKDKALLNFIEPHSIFQMHFSLTQRGN
jgi:hypothetical protein